MEGTHVSIAQGVLLLGNIIIPRAGARTWEEGRGINLHSALRYQTPSNVVVEFIRRRVDGAPDNVSTNKETPRRALLWLVNGSYTVEVQATLLRHAASQTRRRDGRRRETRVTRFEG